MLKRRKNEPTEQQKEDARHNIWVLSNLRANYYIFNDEEWEYYHALSEAIDAVKCKYNLD